MGSPIIMKVELKLLKELYEAVLSGATGCPDQLAERLGISRRFLYVVISYMKTEFDAPIAYSRTRETFYYTEEWEFYVGDLIPIRKEFIKDVFTRRLVGSMHGKNRTF